MSKQGVGQLQEGSETCLGEEKPGAVALGPGHSLAFRPHVTHGTFYLLGNRLGGRPVRKADDFLVHRGQIAEKGQRVM